MSSLVKIEVEPAPTAPLTSCLSLFSTERPTEITYFDEDDFEKCHLARLDFDESGCRFSPQKRQGVIEHVDGGRLCRVNRDFRAEQSALKILETIGFLPAEDVYLLWSRDYSADSAFDDDNEWFPFVLHALPALQAQGWRVEIDSTFAYRIVKPEDGPF